MRWWRRVIADIPGLAEQIAVVTAREKMRARHAGAIEAQADAVRAAEARVASTLTNISRQEANNDIDIKMPWDGPCGVVPFPVDGRTYAATRTCTIRFVTMPMAVTMSTFHGKAHIRWRAIAPEGDVRAIAAEADRAVSSLRRFIEIVDREADRSWPSEAPAALSMAQRECYDLAGRLDAALGRGSFDPRNVTADRVQRERAAARPLPPKDSAPAERMRARLDFYEIFSRWRD